MSTGESLQMTIQTIADHLRDIPKIDENIKVRGEV